MPGTLAIVFRLNKFKEVILDFKDVDSMGQGFADELFRVFMSGHPEIKVHVRNAGDPVKIILGHVVDNNINGRLTIG